MHMRKATAAQHIWDTAKDSSEKCLTVNVAYKVGWLCRGINTAENGLVRKFLSEEADG